MVTEMKRYFFDKAGDERMEKQNQSNWQALARLVEHEANASLPHNKPWDILDIGCHTGGLLELLDKKFSRRLHEGSRVASLSGVEPIEHARDEAKKRISYATFYSHIEKVPTQSIDLVIGNEFLYLEEDLCHWARQLQRILRPEGGAFISLGSHSENTAWLRWRGQLQRQYGHASYVHEPMNILQTGVEVGFDMEIHRLHLEPQTGMRYSPPEEYWGEFISAEEALGFRQQKYVFVFYPKR